MNNSQNKQYLKEGITAISNYELSKLATAIDEFSKTTEKLHFKGTVKNFKSKSLEISKIVLGGTSSMSKFLNKNKYYNQVIQLTQDYIATHPQEVQKFFTDIEQESGIKFSDIGFDNNFYNNFSTALKKQGLVGKPGALNVLSDTVIDNLDSIVDLVTNATKEKPKDYERSYLGLKLGLKPRQWSSVKQSKTSAMGKKSLEFVANAGITVEGIQKAYATSGFSREKGVIGYITDSLIITSKPYADLLLMQLEFSGIKHGLTSDSLIDSYKKNGLFNKDGLIEKLAGIGMKVPNFEIAVYNLLLTTALDDKKKKFNAELCKGLPFGDASIEMRKAVDKRYKTIVANIIATGTPDVISNEKLQKVFNTNGLYGKEGLLNYLNNNISNIYANAIAYGVMEESDTNLVKKIFSQLAMLDSFKDLLKPKETPQEKYAIAIAKKSEELKISPVQLLSDNKYISDKKLAIIEGYGSIDEYFKMSNAPQGLLPYINQTLLTIELGVFTSEKTQELISIYRPKGGILRYGFDKILGKVINKNIIEKTEDYLRLTKSFVDYNTAANQKEALLYQ